MPTRLLWLIRLVLFAVGAYASYKLFPAHWYVGPIFGAVVIAWRADSLKSLLTLRNARFLVSSTLIYALVIEVYGRLGETQSAYYLAVALGTTLLPIAHTLLLGAPWPRTLLTIPSLYAMWFGVTWSIEHLNLDALEKILNMISIWQALYLAFMFTPTRPPAAPSRV